MTDDQEYEAYMLQEYQDAQEQLNESMRDEERAIAEQEYYENYPSPIIDCVTDNDEINLAIKISRRLLYGEK